MAGSIRVTRIKGGFSNLLKNLESKLDQETEAETKDVKADFEKTTSTWNTPVTFTISSMGTAQRKIGTTNKIYSFVSKGTSPHTIRARAGGSLFFLTPYAAKTQPGSLSSGSGAQGSNPVFAQEVQHPGTAARGFDKLVAEKARPRFYKRVKTVISSLNK